MFSLCKWEWGKKSYRPCDLNSWSSWIGILMCPIAFTSIPDQFGSSNSCSLWDVSVHTNRMNRHCRGFVFQIELLPFASSKTLSTNLIAINNSWSIWCQWLFYYIRQILSCAVSGNCTYKTFWIRPEVCSRLCNSRVFSFLWCSSTYARSDWSHLIGERDSGIQNDSKIFGWVRLGNRAIVNEHDRWRSSFERVAPHIYRLITIDARMFQSLAHSANVDAKWKD